MPRNVRKVGTTKRSYRRGRTYRRATRYRRSGYRSLSRRISAVTRRIAGEVCKFEITPNRFSNTLLTPGTGSVPSYTPSTVYTLNNIVSGEPWIMPLNWTYSNVVSTSTTYTTAPYYNGAQQGIPATPVSVSFRQPIWYNTMPGSQEAPDVSAELQYRLKYIYINALFNASILQSTNNTDGALRIVVVKDKQPTGGSATWFDENFTTNSRGVFNANRIDAQLNPSTVGRFRIMYDKTLRFNTVNGYKPFKYYKQLSTVVRNNRNYINGYPIANLSSQNYAQTSDEAPPVQKNAFYLMIFSDGLGFTYSEDPSTPAASFHLFNRIAYYNN